MLTLKLTILGMTTNFVNPSYPGTDSTTGECKFYLVLNSDVCQVRLVELYFDNLYFRVLQVRVDFVDTSMLAPVEGRCSQQSLSVGGTVWPLGVSQFCGRNSDQHFYIEIARTGDLIRKGWSPRSSKVSAQHKHSTQSIGQD